MGVTKRRIDVRPSDVFLVLSDGFSYGHWVVGTRHIRAVDDAWPAQGSRLHYTVGYGPLRKDDQTEVLSMAADRRLELRAHAWPAGTARIILELEPAGDGCLVRIDEFPDQGLAKRLHNPVLDQLIRLRNLETLRRLDGLAVERAAPAG